MVAILKEIALQNPLLALAGALFAFAIAVFILKKIKTLAIIAFIAALCIVFFLYQSGSLNDLKLHDLKGKAMKEVKHKAKQAVVDAIMKE